MYRAVYLEAVDYLGGALERRHQHSGDEGLLLTMEKAVLTGEQEATKTLTDTYPELDAERLPLHLAMLRDVCICANVGTCHSSHSLGRRRC